MSGGADSPFGRDVPGSSRQPRGESSSILHGLTEPQREAVLRTEGPVLILAAAGSGKTRVITRRIAQLLSMGIPAWSILALTFTNKSAGEMRERVAKLLLGEEGVSLGGERALRGLTVTTFHSLCARLLRKYAEPAGLRPEFTIYDSGDQASLCKKVIEQLGLATSNFPPRSVLSAISSAKNALLDAEAFAARAHDWSAKNVAKIYSAYSRSLKAANAVDFDDLLMIMARLLERDADVRHELQRRWQYLMIDEYQDTNHAQFMIASLLAGDGATGTPRQLSNEDRAMGLTEEDLAPSSAKGPNICVVGDPDQAIYGWRGADITNILEFEEHYPGAAVIKLGENFRSTEHILGAADTLIQKNQRRKHKPLFTSKQGGELVEATLCREERHEASLVTDWFKSLHDEGGGEGDSGFPWREMAVFYRTNSLSRVLEESFRQANIPYTIARGTAFYDREEVKNALSYLRVVANPFDDVSLERIVNTPTRGIGDAALTILTREATVSGHAIQSVMRRVRELPGISTRAVAGIQKFTGMLDDWTGGGSFLGSHVPASLADLVDRVIQESGLRAMYQNQARASGSESDLERVDNLDELVSSAREFEQEYDPEGDPALEPTRAADGSDRAPAPPLLSLLRGFLESVSLVADADSIDPAQGSVTLMTLHAAKGLEFKAAAIVGLEEGTLPHSRALGGDAEQMEEERRLCFVGITRAMRRLHLTCAKYRTIRGLPERTIPSRFLSELPREHVRFSDQSDSMAEFRGTAWGEGSDDLDSDSPRFVPDEDGATPRGPGRTAPGQAGTPRGVTPPSIGTKIAHALPPGSIVRHPQFGEGKVLSVTGGMNARAVIRFKDVGEKTMILEHARLTRVR